MAPPPGQPPYGTPAQGNVSFPTGPGAVPPGPANARAAQGGGGNKGMLLGIAAVVGVLSIGAVVFALKGSQSAPAVPLVMPTASASAADVTVLDAGSGLGAVTPPPPDSAVAGLDNGPVTPPGQSHPQQHHDAGAGKGGTNPVGPPHVTPGPSPSPAPPTPAGSEPIECVKARLMRQAGNIALFQQLEKQCVAKGGHI
jgi:hypothetical protein